MGWNTWPYWLRGCVIGIILSIILIILALISAPLHLLNYITIFVIWLAKPFLFISKIITGCYIGEECIGWVYIVVPIALILEGLVFGILFGWIIGKIKGK